MWDIILPILATALTTVLSYVGVRLKMIYEKHVNTREKEAVVKNTVQFVEQVYGALKGAEKLEKAKATALDWLNEKGIEISDAELTILIESAVKEMAKQEAKEEDEDIDEELEYDNIGTLIDEDFIEHNQFLEDEADLDEVLLKSLDDY